MSITLLQREKPVLDDFTSEDLLGDELDTQAKSVGYHRLYEERQKVRNRHSLLQTLTRLDTLPFTDGSVERYKAASEVQPDMRVVMSTIAVFFISLLLSLGALPVLVVSALFGFATVAFYSAIVFLANVAALFLSCYVILRIDNEKTWKLHPLSEYGEPVPEFALQTAVDIKKEFPDAEFYVCALEVNRVIDDPFLVLRTRFGDEERDYYLEVWNESQFEGERQV